MTKEEILSRLAETFDPDMLSSFTGPDSLYGGLFLGFLLGFILQKGGLCKYGVISGLFRMEDFTFFRVGMPLLMVGMVLVFLFNDLGYISLYVPKTIVFGQLLGGIIFGAGMAIAGYCPTIAAGALGEGAFDAIFAIIGMIAGSILYAEFFHNSSLEKITGVIDLGRITFEDIFIVFNHWFFIIAFGAMGTMFLIGITIYDIFLKYSLRSLNIISKIFK